MQRNNLTEKKRQMKKIFTIVFLAFIAFAANAQSLRLIRENGTTVGNNDIIEVVLDGTQEEVNTYIGYENLTDQQVGFYVKKEVFAFDDHVNPIITFCIGNCYTGDLSELTTVEPNTTVAPSDLYAFHSSYLGDPSNASVRYTFYNAENESDRVSFTINYKYGVGIRQADAAGKLLASPNPATTNVTVSYTAPSGNSDIVIKNLTGKEVFRTGINGGTGSVRINVTEFAAGVYFYGIESDGKMVCTKKLLVK